MVSVDVKHHVYLLTETIYFLFLIPTVFIISCIISFTVLASATSAEVKLIGGRAREREEGGRWGALIVPTHRFFFEVTKYRLLLACEKSSSLFDHLMNMTLHSDKQLFFPSISMCFSPDSELVIYTFIPTTEETKDNHVDCRQNDTVLSSLALLFRHYGTVSCRA